MAIDFGKALGIHPEALKLRAERTKILASNIANDSTPGYQARDIDFAATLRSVAAGPDSGTGGGSAGADALFAEGAEMLYRVPFSPSQDGNTVEIGVEQAAFSQNAADFQTSLTFVNMKIKGLSEAIKGQ